MCRTYLWYGINIMAVAAKQFTVFIPHSKYLNTNNWMHSKAALVPQLYHKCINNAVYHTILPYLFHRSSIGHGEACQNQIKWWFVMCHELIRYDTNWLITSIGTVKHTVEGLFSGINNQKEWFNNHQGRDGVIIVIPKGSLFHWRIRGNVCLSCLAMACGLWNFCIPKRYAIAICLLEFCD